ncbi:CBS domain-containing protein [Pseudoalteromonas sp. G4]|uniref:CBS domain-containing protein n=1 Tax=Pseudoalteromonas sp. G4 TaxID=2992761 RepID=UPI00237EA7EA|nr:CBS domain-containing protein [Pseudoalteromonas sp. G4]MDE3272941.1 CBS domain-containing protein [Pseudoalteromonas sp. G4]
MTDFRVIETIPMSNVQSISSMCDTEALDISSNASHIVTDFNQKRPQFIEKDVLVDEALYMMKMGHVRSKIVIDHDENFMGVISSSDLSSYKVLHNAQLRNVPRADLTVENLMVKKEDMRAINFSKISNYTIGDVLATLRNLGQQHVLLIDQDHALRGLISASDIARVLHIPININEKAHTFKEIFDVVFAQIEKQKSS